METDLIVHISFSFFSSFIIVSACHDPLPLEPVPIQLNGDLKIESRLIALDAAKLLPYGASPS